MPLSMSSLLRLIGVGRMVSPAAMPVADRAGKGRLVASRKRSQRTVATGGASKEATESVLDDHRKLPPIDVVLTASKGVLEGAENQRDKFAVVASGSGFVVLVEQGFANTTHFLSQIQRLRSKDIVQYKQVFATSAVIAFVHKDYEDRHKKSDTALYDASAEPQSLLMFREVMEAALAKRASDIHVMARRPMGMICFRIDGIIRPWKQFNYDDLSRFSGFGFMKLAEEGSRSDASYSDRQVQSCMIPFVGKKPVKLRYQSLPVLGGFDVVMRILFTEATDEKPKTLCQLGYAPSQQRDLELAVRMPIGAVILAGVTGSGKTTTLMTLQTLRRDRLERKSYSVEDPVEYKVYGVSQVSVQRSASASDEGKDSPYLPYLRALMRMDPDAITIGEIRDRQTGGAMRSMVESGHQVFSTVHAPGGLDIIPRLTSDAIGLPRDFLSGRTSISALVYQALIPCLCPHCKVPAVEKMSAERLDLLEAKFGIDPATVYVAREGGCDACEKQGTKGQTLAAEVILPDINLLRLIRNGDDFEAERYWRGLRRQPFADPDMTGKTAFEHGLYKVSQGLVDPRSVEGAFCPMERYQVFEMEGF